MVLQEPTLLVPGSAQHVPKSAISENLVLFHREFEQQK